MSRKWQAMGHFYGSPLSKMHIWFYTGLLWEYESHTNSVTGTLGPTPKHDRFNILKSFYWIALCKDKTEKMFWFSRMFNMYRPEGSRTIKDSTQVGECLMNLLQKYTSTRMLFHYSQQINELPPKRLQISESGKVTE